MYLFSTLRECKQFEQTCIAFSAEPWVAVYFEREREGDLYLTSLANYHARYWLRDVAIGSWKMTSKSRNDYMHDLG